jgi:hypothetical protein
MLPTVKINFKLLQTTSSVDHYQKMVFSLP